MDTTLEPYTDLLQVQLLHHLLSLERREVGMEEKFHLLYAHNLVGQSSHSPVVLASFPLLSAQVAAGQASLPLQSRSAQVRLSHVLLLPHSLLATSRHPRSPA